MSFNEFPGREKNVSLIGVPLGFGAGKQGSELGVDAMRMSRIRDRLLVELIEDLGYAVDDRGNVEIIKPNYVAAPDDNPKYLRKW